MAPWILIVILGAAVIGYAYLRPKDANIQQISVINDIETTLDQFAEELEEDNRELMNTISGLKRELEAQINKLNGRIEALEKHNTNNDSQSLPQEKSGAAPVEKKQKAEINIEQTVDAPEIEPNIKNRFGRLFELHTQGKSIEYIAKKIGMNKGEVQLIIQLARQEEQFRA